METQTMDAPTGLKRPVISDKTQSLDEQQIRRLSAYHYGYVPYDDIDLMGPNGLERHVAYADDGNLASVLTRSDLLLFRNVELRKLGSTDNPKPGGTAPGGFGNEPVLDGITKYAASCIQEVHDAYAKEWGFTILSPLTGLSPEVAFRIFEVIQPERYDLLALGDQLRIEAPKRIAAAVAADEHFPEKIADDTRLLMLIGWGNAFRHANKVVNELRTDMATFLGTKQGKSYATPGDEHAFNQLHQPIPSPIAAQAQSSDDLKDLMKLVAAKLLQGSPLNAQEDQLSTALAAIESIKQTNESLAEEVAQLRAAETARKQAEANDESEKLVA